MIFDVPEMRGLSCFEIAHSKTCQGLWTNIGGSRRTTNNFGKGKIGYSVSTSHPVYKLLLDKYGLSKKKGSKNKRMDDIDAAPDGWSEDEATPPDSTPDGRKGKSELFDTSSSEDEEVEEMGMEEGGNEVSVVSKYLLKFWAAIRYLLTIICTATQLLLSLSLLRRRRRRRRRMDMLDMVWHRVWEED